MNLNNLMYFQTLAKYEHYGKAAEELHITQPSLSKAIQNLERDLEVSLFEKSGRGIRLTKQGKRYLEYVDHALNELQTGSDVLRYERISSGSYLSIGIVQSASWMDFSDWIREFRDYFGKPVFFSARNTDTETLALELKNGKLDLILCPDLQDAKIEFAPVRSLSLTLLVPPSHRFSGRSSVDISELNGERFIAHMRGSSIHNTLGDIYRDHNIQVSIVGEAEEDWTLAAMVRAGVGCAVTFFSQDFSGKGLKSVPITGTGFSGEICIGRRAGMPLPAPADEFYNWLSGNRMTHPVKS